MVEIYWQTSRMKERDAEKPGPKSGKRTKEFRFVTPFFPLESRILDVPYRTNVGNVGDNEVPVSLRDQLVRSDRFPRGTRDDRLRSIKLTDGALHPAPRPTTSRFGRAIFIRSIGAISSRVSLLYIEISRTKRRCNVSNK